MMPRNQAVTIVMLLLVAISVAACQPAQASSAAAPTIPQILLKLADFSYTMPKQITAGLVEFKVENDGKEPHHAQLLRLNEGVTPAQFKAAIQQGPEAILRIATVAGGPGVSDPGVNGVSVIINLQPGHYFALCFIVSSDHLPHLAKGMIADFEVTAASGQAVAPDPQTDQEVQLLDFSFVLPQAIKPGKQTWKVSNSGQQPHEMMLLKLGAGKTMDDVMAFMKNPTGAPPFADVGGFQAVNPGVTGWLRFDLAAGNYIAICHVPDPVSHQEHAALGMLLPFTVQ